MGTLLKKLKNESSAKDVSPQLVGTREPSVFITAIIMLGRLDALSFDAHV
jgi:hypothetical protein